MLDKHWTIFMVLYAIFYRVTSLSVSINDRYLSVIQHYTRLPPYKTEKKKNVDPSTHYDLVGKLGEGAFGDVWKAKNRITQKYAAAKIIETGSEAEIEEHYGEIEILIKCNHQESQ